MSQFFIHRPVFAWVIAIVTMLLGGLGMTGLPIAQYPDIAPTTVTIRASYNGASAEIVADSVTTVIEDAMTGIEGMIYMTSSSSPGSATVTLTFDDSIDADIAQVQVQNKLQLAQAQLPQIVQQTGLSVSRSSSSILLVAALTSSDGARSAVELGDIAARMLEDPILRTPGVGSIQSFGAGYAMRIWLDPMKLVQYQITPADVMSAVGDQNTNVTVGTLGSQPVQEGQRLTIPISAQSQLSTVEEFENILLRVMEDGSTVFLGDVATVGIGQESYAFNTTYNGKPATGFAVNLATGANAVTTAAAVRDTMDRIAPSLPEGVQIVIPYDTSPFVEKSISQVYKTLLEAVALVFIVILVFLQNWRATLIPVIAIPVVLLGTFGILSVAGFSINTLTMFALVLAIGLLVDDAIVVVENVERVMEETGLGPVEATEQSMKEITSALVGIVTVLSAVFLPMAFMGGSTGVIYRQFSVTIISAMVLSLGVAVILTPAMCATMLKHRKHGGGFFLARWFNRGLDKTTSGYGHSVRLLVRRPIFAMLILLGVSWFALGKFQDLPSSFIPQEDQGVLMAIVEAPRGSTMATTEALLRNVENHLLTSEAESVEAVFGITGFSMSGPGQHGAMLFVKLRDYAEREGQSAADLVNRVNGHFYMTNRGGTVYFLQPPAIQGLGASAGFSMYLVDQAGNGQAALAEAATRLVQAGMADGRVTNLRGNDAPFQTALRLEIDQQKASAYGLRISEINAMLSVIFSGREVNDFALGNDLRPVIIQGDTAARGSPEDIDRWYARNANGEMVPFSAFSTQHWDEEAQGLARFGGARALEISGEAAAGLSSGAAMAVMEELVAGLGGGYSVDWTGLSYQERLSGNQAPMLFALAALIVFLALAALYESWSVPFAVMLAVPIGILGAVIAADMFGQSNDVYFKVGLLTTIGLAARNAILIVEFAQQLYKEGQSLRDAAVNAARMRLRPILMTTFAFMLGVLPLAIATGAGAGAQNSIGIGVLGGMTSSGAIGIFLVPAFYVGVIATVERLSRKKKKDAHA